MTRATRRSIWPDSLVHSRIREQTGVVCRDRGSHQGGPGRRLGDDAAGFHEPGPLGASSPAGPGRFRARRPRSADRRSPSPPHIPARGSAAGSGWAPYPRTTSRMIAATSGSAPCSRSSSIRASGSIIGCGRPPVYSSSPRSRHWCDPAGAGRPHAGLIGVLDRPHRSSGRGGRGLVAEGAAGEQPSDQGTARRHPSARLFNGGTHRQSSGPGLPIPRTSRSPSTRPRGCRRARPGRCRELRIQPEQRADQGVSPAAASTSAATSGAGGLETSRMTSV